MAYTMAHAGNGDGLNESDLSPDLLTEIDGLAKQHADLLVSTRRDLHAHPELAYSEFRATSVVSRRLQEAGLRPQPLPGSTGLICDIGSGERMVALRADLDALAVHDTKDVPYRSTVPGVCHACGHDVHTAVVLGAGLVLAELANRRAFDGRVRLIFQPAEEIMPGGSQVVLDHDGLAGVERIFCVHCDPRLPTGRVGLRSGPITSACDRIEVRMRGLGGHTARAHLTGDLVQALGAVVTSLPTVLSRRLDPRAGVSLVWGRISAGTAANAVPADGIAEGTLRCLDVSAWDEAPEILRTVTAQLVAPYGVGVEVDVERGVPPVVNDPASTSMLRAAADAVLGPEAFAVTDQSLGAEDFAWYLQRVPGALARLGVRRPGQATAQDLHQGSFDPDEEAIGVGARFLAAAALVALGSSA